MAEEEILKIEADERGVWISGEAMKFSQNDVFALLKSHGVRHYELSAIEEFIRARTGRRCKIASRDKEKENGADIHVKVSGDGMTASILIEPPFFLNPWPNEADVLRALEANSIAFGIDMAGIRKALSERNSEEYTVVARGRPPLNGKDAVIEMLIDPKKPLEIREDEKVDFWSRSAIVNVTTGDEVAIKHPAVKGRDGMTVLGKLVKAVKGKNVEFQAGEGLEKPDDRPNTLVATTDGQLKWKDRKLVVLPELEILGSVDFSVGSIDFPGAVRIGGTVHSGFHVIAQGGVEIKEMVEGAVVDSQGDVSIRGGVRGMNKGTIRAAGDVSLGFADQATIHSGGTVTVKNALLHSNIFANTAVIVLGAGQKSQIAGGRVEAGMEVACHVLGSEMGTRTEVVVGLPPDMLERRRTLMAEVSRCEENINKIDPNMTLLKKLEEAGQLDDQKRTMLASLTKMKFQLQSAVESMNIELADIELRFQEFNDRAIVRVKEVCHSGVQITIRGLTYLVREDCKYTSFIVDDGVVTLRPFDYMMKKEEKEKSRSKPDS